jgi:hypothetical protein
VSPKAVKGQNALVQATIFKKCDRTNHKPDSNKLCAGGTCFGQLTEREQSFGTLTEAQTFQLTLSTGRQTQGAMFVDPAPGSWNFCRCVTPT